MERRRKRSTWEKWRNGKRSAGQVQVEMEVEVDVHTYVVFRQLTLMMSLNHVSLFQSLTDHRYSTSLSLSLYTFVSSIFDQTHTHFSFSFFIYLQHFFFSLHGTSSLNPQIFSFGFLRISKLDNKCVCMWLNR